MLRTFAQLYSSIYDVKEIGVIVANSSFNGFSHERYGSFKTFNQFNYSQNSSTLGESQTLTQFDFKKFLAISVGYNLLHLQKSSPMSKRRSHSHQSL